MVRILARGPRGRRGTCSAAWFFLGSGSEWRSGKSSRSRGRAHLKRQPHKKTGRARRTQIQQHEAALDWVCLAFDAFRARDLEEAEKAARRALRIEPGHGDATLLLGELLFRSSRLREIPGLLREAILKHPNDPRLHFLLADSALDIGELHEARRAALRFQELLDRGIDMGLGPVGGRRRPYLTRSRAILKEVDRQLAQEAKAQSRAGASRKTEPPPSPGPAAGGSPSDLGPAIRVRAEAAHQAAPPTPAGTALQRSLFDAAPTRAAAPPTTGRAATLARAATPDVSPRPLRQAVTAAPVAASPSPARSGPAVAASGVTSSVPKIALHVEEEAAQSATQWLDLAQPESWNDDLQGRELLLESQRITLLSHYAELLCLPTLVGVDRLGFQVETARKILRRLSGRALLCDEVGLGKTIEAGMVIKEYLLRGLAQSVLVLVPPGLVRQWQDEMSQKFGLELGLWSGDRDPERGSDPLLAIGSIAFARHERNFTAFTEHEWDLVVVDEAHHLRRRSSRSWALVNALRKRYLLLLSATPVHNDLMELYELVTLVKPGLLGTPAEFRREFASGKDGRRARHPERLRELLGEVMVRNTRSHADVALPRRFATTLVLQPQPSEARAYKAASEYSRLVYPTAGTTTRTWLRHLLGCAGSGPRAVGEAAARRLGSATLIPLVVSESEADPDAAPDLLPPDAAAGEHGHLLRDIVAAAGSASASTKSDRLLELISGSDDQMIVFCRFRATLSELSERLSAQGVSHCVYHGGLLRREKDAAIDRFRAGARVLLCTESGGEGRNIHFCRTIVNYDLPWDPMRIEQRIGRVHRIGQTRDVFVFNLVLAGTVEEELLRILEEKIHLFELIVGEVDSILGHLERREEFADILLGLWASASDDTERRRYFESFGEELATARAAYEGEKALGDTLLADELEV